MAKRMLAWVLSLVFMASLLPLEARGAGEVRDSAVSEGSVVQVVSEEPSEPPALPEEEELTGALLSTGVFGDFGYSLTETGVTITDYTGAGGAVTIPAEIEGSPVVAIGSSVFSGEALTAITLPSTLTSIGNYAFQNCDGLTSVVLPDSLTTLGSYAFRNCTALASITYPKGLTSVGSRGAFSGCTALKQVTVPEGVTALPNYVFYNCASLEGVSLPSTLTVIGSNAFRNCTGLTGLTLPQGLEEIGTYAFAGCSNLASVVFPDNLTTLGSNAFQDCASLEGVSLPGSLTAIGSYAFRDCTGLTVLTLPQGLEEIGTYAFAGCSDLASVVFPDSLTTLGSHAFQNCTALASITYPKGLTSVGSNGAFAGCTALKQVTVPEGVTALPDRVFYNCASLEGVSLPSTLTAIGSYAFRNCAGLTTVTLPQGLTEIDTYAFADCSKLASVVFPDSLTTLGNYAFQDCASLEGVSLPGTLTAIGSYAFQNCTSLTALTLPEGLTKIGTYAFADCSKLASVVFPDSLTTLERHAFRDCTALASITYPEGLTSVGNSGVFSGCTALKQVTVPEGVTALPNYLFYNCAALEEVSLPGTLTAIGSNVFQGCTGLSSVVLPEGLTQVGGNAFYQCSGLTQISMPDTLTTIGSNAFRYCTGLTTLTLPEGLEEIETYAFAGCSNLASVVFPDSLTTMGNYAFRDCAALASITYPKGLTSVGSSGVFSGCTALKQVTVPEGVTALPDRVFYNCASLEEVSLPSTLTTIGSNVFQNCTGLISVVLPEGLTQMGSNAFYGCSNLTKLSLPSTLTAISSNAFQNCTSLTEVTFAQGLTEIGSNAFRSCTGLTTLTLPQGLTEIGMYAFLGCSNLTSVVFPDSLTTLESNAFQNCTALASMNYPKGLTTVGISGAFAGCTALKQVTVPEGVTALPSYVFSNAASLEEVILPSTLTSIGGSAFQKCTGLTAIVLPDTLTSIGNYAFDGCSALRSINLPTDVTIGVDAFRGCALGGDCGPDAQWSLDLEEREMTISGTGAISLEGEQAPWYGLKNYVGHVTIGPEITSIADGAFADCTELTSVVLPDSVTEVGSRAFAGCTSLKRIELSANLQTVGDDAFAGCGNVDTMIFCGDLPQIGQNAMPPAEGYKAYYPKTADGWSDEAVSQYPAAQWSMWDDTLPTRDIVLLLDVSGSMAGSRLTALKEAVNTFADQVGGRLTNTRIAVISYASEAAVEMPLSTDVEWLHNRVNRMTATGSTYYLKGLDAVNAMLSESESDVKSVILFSDGAPSDSQSSILTQAAAMRADYYIYTVGLTPTATQRQLLINVAGTEQNYFEAEDIQALVELFISISENIGEENLTEVTMTRGGAQINALTESQSFEQGSEEVVDLQVTPYWSDSVPGTIRITQRGQTILESETGTFTGVAPGKLFQPLERIYVVLVDADGRITAMVKTQIDIAVAESSRQEAGTTQIALTVYENKKESGSGSASYILSSGAKITAGGKSYLTGDNGQVQIPAVTEGSVTVEKEGFVSRTLTAAQLNASKKIYLQKASDKPVISAVWLGDVDVLNQDCGMDLLSKESVTLRAEVSWGKGGQGTLALVQDARRVQFTGDSLTTVLSDNFDLSETLYIVATDGSGATVKEPLKFETGSVSAIPDVLDGASFALGSSISLTLPDSIKPDFFAGTEVSAGISSIVPITITTEDGKVYVAIGADLVSYENSDKWATSTESGNRAHTLTRETKTFISKLKDTGVFDTGGASSSLKKLKSLEQTYRRALRYPQGSFGFEADFTLLGFAEGYINEQGGVTWLDGGVIFNPSVGASMNLPFALGPVPMFFEASLTGEVTAQLNIIFNEAAKNFLPNGQISGKVTLSGGVCAGIKNVLYVGGGLEGSLKPDWRIYTGGRQDSFKLTASVNAYAKIGIAFFEYKKSWDPFYDAVWIEYPQQNKNVLFSSMLEEAYDPISYTPKDLSYLDGSSQFLPEDSNPSLMGDASAAQILKTNIYRESTPQYVRFADGTALAVWIDAADSGSNSLQLYYSYYNGGSWSSPALVCGDGTLDYAPQLVLVNGTAWVVWQNAVRTFTQEETLESIAPDFDISAASFTPGSGFGAPATFTRQGLDMLPTLCGDEDGVVYAVWVNNSNNDWFGSGANSILYAACTDGTWSEVKAAYTGLGAIDALAADGQKGLQLAYCMETDGVARLYENGQPVEEAQSPASSPCYLEHTLYWAEEGGINWMGNKSAPSLPGVSRFQLLTGGGERAVLYTVSNGLYSTLNLSYYNEELGQWCQPVALTDGTGFVGAFSGAMAADGTVEVLLNHQQVTGTFQDDDPYGTAQLERIALASQYDLTMGELIYDAGAYSAGSDMELSFQLTNNGSRTIPAVVIQVTGDGGAELSSIVMDDPLAPGQTMTAATYFRVAEGQTSQTVTVTATPQDLTDSNLTDNSRTVTLSFEDVAVEGASWGEKADGSMALFASVVNYGYTKRTGLTVELRSASLTGPVVAQTTVAELEPLGLAQVSFDLAVSGAQVYYVAIKDSGDEFTANDSDFIALGGDGVATFAEIGSVSSTGVELTLRNSQAGTCLAAVYGENNQLLTVGALQVEANAGAIQVPYPIFDQSAAREIRVFLLDQDLNPLYPQVEKELN